MNLDDSILMHMWRMPATTVTLLFNIGVHGAILHRGVDLTGIAFRYTDIVEKHEWWRFLTCSVTHFNLLHLAFNMSSAYSLGVLEQMVGSLEYLKIVLFLMVFSCMLQLIAYSILIRGFGKEHYRDAVGVGYSCVVFGLMTIVSQFFPSYEISVFGQLNIPINFAPISSLVLTQIMIPQASFIGHFAGIVVGFMYSFGLSSVLSGWIGWVTVLGAVSVLALTYFRPKVDWEAWKGKLMPFRSGYAPLSSGEEQV
jgi:membrane associated rhomboid family serine protease